MSASTMQASAQPPTSSSPYTTASNRYPLQTSRSQYAYESNQDIDPNQQTRQSRRQNGYEDNSGYSSSQQASYAPHISSPSNPLPFDLPDRSKPYQEDQYDGAPIPPPRTSSQQPSFPAIAPPSTAPLDERVESARYARQNAATAQAYSSPNQNYSGDYNEPVRERSRDAAATAAPDSARSRRKEDGQYRATDTRERGQQSATASQSRSEAAMQNSRPLPMRENSEVLNRVVVSDPTEDAERLRERVAEAQPAPISSDITPVTGLGLVGSEGVEDGGRGGQKRQDFSKSSSRRKDVQFGDYMLGQTLGEGEFGKVKLGWKKDGSSQVAIKLIRRETVASNPTRLPKIYREISILRELQHPNIVRLHEMVETERHIGIILEYASGGELFDYILTHRYLKDQAARRLFAQLVSGVGYLHKKGIVHRDLKLENLLLDQNRNIIITDFGFANTFNPGDELGAEIEYNLGNRDFVRKYRLDRQDEQGRRRGDLMQTSCGSPCYAAPELVVSDSLYTGRKVDVWSCGVILYAMLAGYLPFDDDPANPEGDNINLLYKYITNTALTFPEYVTPHARDLLRRILQPDPRKRADLFEVARHSWLQEYHHVVSHITSSTTNVADIANTTVPSERSPAQPVMNRSVSVREPSKPTTRSPDPRLATQEDQVGAMAGPEATRQKSTRHTLQPEYVAPSTHTSRGPAPGVAATTAPPSAYQKPLPQDPPVDAVIRGASGQKMPPPARPGRDVPRSASDSTGAFATAPAEQDPSAYEQVTQQVTRPSTGGTMTSAPGPNGTRSDLRLPSRGSYGQPVAPTVAATNAQGRVTQPSKNSRGYNISGPIPQHTSHNSIGQPMMTQQSVPPANEKLSSMPPPVTAGKGHHRRSSTLSGLGERLFGRSMSTRRKDKDEPLQKNGRKYPPTAMKQYSEEGGTLNPRASMDSKRSFSFGLGKKRSTDLESQSGDKANRRFSLIPHSVSQRLFGGSRDQVNETSSPQTSDFPQPPSHSTSRPSTNQQPTEDFQQNYSTGNDGSRDQYRTSSNKNYSRPSQQGYSQQGYSQPQQYSQTQQSSNDVYGGTGVYGQDQRQAQNQQAYSQNQYRQPQYQSQPQTYRLPQGQSQRPVYPDGFNSDDAAPPRQSMQQGRPTQGKLTKNNRKFNDGYGDQGSHGGRSGAVKKVQDFFRLRGRTRADSDADY